MMLSRRQFTHLSLGASALAASPWSFAQAEEIVMWGPPVAPTLLLALAAQQEVMQKQYPGVQAKVWRNPDMLRAGLANHTIPLVIAPSYVAANFRNRGQDIGMLNIMTFGLLYMLGKDDKVTALEDLVGKKVVMPFKQDMPDLVLQSLLKKAGIGKDKVTLSYTSTPQEALGLLIAGQVDLALLPEPIATMASLKGKAMGIARRLDIQELWGHYMDTNSRTPQAGLIVTRDFYEKNQEFLKNLQAPLQTALEFALQNPKQAAEQTAEVMDLPVPVMANSIPHAHLTASNASDLQEEIMAFLEVLQSLNPKIVGGKMPDDSLIWKMPT